MLSPERSKLLSLHTPALLFALLVLLMSACPFLLAPHLVSQSNGAPLFFQSDEDIYLSRIREVYDGYPLVSSPVFLEYKSSPSVVLPIGDYFYLIPTVFGASMLLSVTIMKVLLPSVLFFLIYLFVLAVLDSQSSGDRWARATAIAASLLVIFGFGLADVRHFFLFSDLSNLPFSFPIWMRLVNPVTGAIFLFFLLRILWRIFNGDNRRIRVLSAGLVLALSSGYIFSFGIAVSIIFVLGIVSLILKRRKSFWSLIYIGVIGSLPLFIETFISLRNKAESAVSLSRNGLFLTHMPIWNTLLLLAIFIYICLIVFIKRTKASLPDWVYFSSALLVGSFIALNEQIITGRTIWPAHFVSYSIPIVYISLLIAAYFIVFPRWRRIYQACTLLLLGFCIFAGLASLNTFRQKLPDYKALALEMPAFAWLNDNASKPCVVLAYENEVNLSYKIPGYTRCESYYSVYNFFGVPEDRILQSYLSLLRLRGVKADNIDAYLKADWQEVKANFFRDWRDIFYESTDPWLISISDRGEIAKWYADLDAKLAADYRAFLKQDFLTELKSYRLDYVIWDENKEPKMLPPAFSFLKEVYSENGIHIYAVSQ